MACGYLPPVARVHLRVWSHQGYRGPAPTVCVGYTSKLPEVIETSRARLHWSKGSLSAFTQGEQPTESLVVAIEVLDVETSQMENWVVSNPKKEGA